MSRQSLMERNPLESTGIGAANDVPFLRDRFRRYQEASQATLHPSPLKSGPNARIRYQKGEKEITL